jgi:hypothetical protein
VPAARYAFALGGHLWTMGADGLPSVVRAGNTNAQTLRRFTLPPARWAPSGDRLLTVETLASGASSQQLVAVAVSRDGSVRRYTTPSSVATGTAWSPDGTQLAVVALPAGANDPAVLASDLNVVLLDANTGGTVRSIPGREVAWTKGGVVVLSNGTFRGGDLTRDDQAIEIWSGGDRKVLATIARIVSGVPALASPAPARGTTQTAGLTASNDGSYASVHLAVLGRTQTTSVFVAVRGSDARPTVLVSGDLVVDEAWSPAGRHIGFTRQTGTGAAAPRRATVRDAETGETLLDLDGRFAGWSPDGAWAYVARNEGLFARRLAGGELQRVSPYGVVVSITTP